MSNSLPKRFKEVKGEDLIKIRKNRIFFLLFMLLGNILHGSALAVLQNPEFSQYCKISLESFTVLGLIIHSISIIGILLVILSLIFLYKTCKILYISSYKYGNLGAYIISFFIPSGGFILLMVVLGVFFDTRKALNYLRNKKK